MNLHSALVVLAKAGFADLHSERLHDSAQVFYDAVLSAFEGMTQEDIKEALRWAFQDDREDMQLRLMACFGFFIGKLSQQVDNIRVSTPEEWKQHSAAMEALHADPSACAVCMTSRPPEMEGNVWTCKQCGATFVRNGKKSAWRKSHVTVHAYIKGETHDRILVYTCAVGPGILMPTHESIQAMMASCPGCTFEQEHTGSEWKLWAIKPKPCECQEFGWSDGYMVNSKYTCPKCSRVYEFIQQGTPPKEWKDWGWKEVSPTAATSSAPATPAPSGPASPPAHPTAH